MIFIGLFILLIVSVLLVLYGSNAEKSALWSSRLALVACGFLLAELYIRSTPFPNSALIMAAFTLFLAAMVQKFSVRYMAGDRDYRRFFVLLNLQAASVLAVIFTQNLLTLLVCWGLNQWVLTRLLMLKKDWSAASASALLALKTFFIGFVALALAFLWFYLVDGVATISDTTASASVVPVVLISIAAMSQLGMWPFHRWLVSSLNAPTPVSALMHAGVINGGGLLIVRFSNLAVEHSVMLTFLFVVGTVSMLFGSFCKLVSVSVKQSLTCSTLAQMGFMIIQCGLGLFSAAVVHLIWHGIYKAYLFLGSASAVEPRDKAPPAALKGAEWLLALLFASFGSYFFMKILGISLTAMQTDVLLGLFCWITLFQVSWNLLSRYKNLTARLALPLIMAVLGSLYGVSVLSVELFMGNSYSSQPYPITWVQGVMIVATLAVWVGYSLAQRFDLNESSFYRWFYVKCVNASQPHPQTVAVARNHRAH